MRSRLGLVALCSAVSSSAMSSGCAAPATLGPDDLEVVENGEPAADPPEPARWELTLACSAAAPPAPEQPIELSVPLPIAGRWQRVLSLVWEVGPPGEAAIEEDGSGERILRVRATGAVPEVSVRARIEQPALEPGPLPEPVRGLSSSLTPGAWVEAARARAVEARLVFGVAPPEGQGEATGGTWPEVRVADGSWEPVDLTQGRLSQPGIRLGTSPARAQVEGAPLPLRVRYGLE